MNYYERHIGDYLKDTAHLSMLEDGAYNRLIDQYYSREQSLPASIKDCCKLARATSKAERAAVALVLEEFFVLTDNGHQQKRCDDEIERFLGKRAKAKASADARWNDMRLASERNANASPPSMRTHPERISEHDANAMPRAHAPERTRARAPARPQSPVTSHQTPEEKRPSPKAPKGAGSVHEFPPGFERFWNAYPKKVGKDAAAKAFAQRKPDANLVDAMVAAIATQRGSEQWIKEGGRFIPNPSTWLNQGRWMDEIGVASEINVFAGAR